MATIPDTTVDAQALLDYLQAPPAELETRVARALQASKLVIADALATAWKDVPVDVVDTLVLEVGAEFYARADSPSGASQYAQLDGPVPVRSARDPLTRVYPIIHRYVVPL